MRTLVETVTMSELFEIASTSIMAETLVMPNANKYVMPEENVVHTQYNQTNNVTVDIEPTNVVHGLFTTLHGYQVTVSTLIISVVMIVVGFGIILLNCLLIHTLRKYHAQLEVTDMFIHSLAVTDAVLGVLVLYNSAYNVANFQNRPECLIRFGAIHAMLMNSTGHIVLLTINRYIKIVKPLQYLQYFKKWRVVTCSAVTWCFSITIGILPILGWNLEYTPQGDEKETVCRYFGIMKPIYIMINVSLYWIPMILMIVLYSHVCRITLKHTREIKAQERAIHGKDLGVFDKRSWRFTKTVFIVIGVYFVCWFPTGTFFMIQVAGYINNLSYETQGNILTFTTAFGFLNSLLNPIIYATKIPCVKQRFRAVFCCRQHSRRQSLGSIMSPTDSIVTIASKRRTSNASIQQSTL